MKAEKPEQDVLGKEIRNNHFRVVIFGSARIKQGTKPYETVYNLAGKIGAEGMDVVTGGGPGLMEAAMAGHFVGRKSPEVHEIGLQIRLPHEQRDSKHMDIKKEFDHFSGRLDTFMKLANCVVVAPGGVGTLLELFYTWQLIQVHHKERIPIILLGGMWFDLYHWIKRWPLHFRDLNPEDVEVLHPVRTIDDAMKVIREERNRWKRRTNG